MEKFRLLLILIIVATYVMAVMMFLAFCLENVFSRRQNIMLLSYAKNKIIYRSPSSFFGFIGLDLFIFLIGLIATGCSAEFLKYLGKSASLMFFLKFVFSSFVSVACFLSSYYILREIDLNRVTIFDKDRQIVTVERRTIFGKRIVRYPLQEICNVKLEAGCGDDNGQDSYELVAILNNCRTISLDSFFTTGKEIDEVREQAAKKIKIFLDI